MRDNFQVYNNINDSALSINTHANNDEFRYITLRAPDCYSGITAVLVFDGGSNFAGTTTIVFPEPELEEGERAEGNLILGVTDESFTLVNGGNGYEPLDVFDIVNENDQLVGYFFVGDVDDNGSILNFFTLNMFEYSCTVAPTIKWTTNTSANVTSNDQNFTILAVEMTKIGSGYEYYVQKNGIPTKVRHRAVLQNYGNGKSPTVHLCQRPLMKGSVIDKETIDPSNNVLIGFENFKIDPASLTYVDNNLYIKGL